MQPGEPILLLCHAFPPINDIGGRRWAKFAKELARRGHPVHVIRSTPHPGSKNSLWSGDVQHPNIIHHPIPARYPAVMTRWPLTSLRDKLMYRFWLRVLPLRTKGNYFDESCLSRQDVLHLASSLIREHGIRHVIATGAPFRLLVYAAELKQLMPRLNVVADFRDEWTWKGHYGLSSLPQARQAYERQLEAGVLHGSDKVISPHPAVIRHLQSTYSGTASRYAVVPNVVDPDDLRLSVQPKENGQFRMIYAGSFYGAEEADVYLNALFDAFKTLSTNEHGPSSKCRFDLYITGQGTAKYAQRVKEHGLGEQIRFHAPLAPTEIFNQIASSDLVVTFIPHMNKDILGTKFHEIFYLRKPMLHVGEPGLVSRTLIERKLGASVRVDELATELPKIIRGERKIEIDRAADHSAYLLGPVTDRLIYEVLT